MKIWDVFSGKCQNTKQFDYNKDVSFSKTGHIDLIKSNSNLNVQDYITGKHQSFQINKISSSVLIITDDIAIVGINKDQESDAQYNILPQDSPKKDHIDSPKKDYIDSPRKKNDSPIKFSPIKTQDSPIKISPIKTQDYPIKFSPPYKFSSIDQDIDSTILSQNIPKKHISEDMPHNTPQKQFFDDSKFDNSDSPIKFSQITPSNNQDSPIKISPNKTIKPSKIIKNRLGLINLNSDSKIKQFEGNGHETLINQIIISDDYLVLSTDGNEGVLQDTQLREEINRLKGHNREIISMAISKTARKTGYCITGSNDCTAILWSIDNNSSINNINNNDSSLIQHQWQFDDPVSVVAISSKNVAIYTRNGILLFYNLNNCYKYHIRMNMDEVITSIVLSDDGSFAVLSSGNVVKIIDVEARRIVRSFSGHTDQIIGIGLIDRIDEESEKMIDK